MRRHFDSRFKYTTVPAKKTDATEELQHGKPFNKEGCDCNAFANCNSFHTTVVLNIWLLVTRKTSGPNLINLLGV